jgi:FixJ family two-component response regulator
MTRDQALSQLAAVHRDVLDLLADGYDHNDIAARLGIEPVAVAPLVVVAHRKLDRLIDQQLDTDDLPGLPGQEQGGPR